MFVNGIATLQPKIVLIPGNMMCRRQFEPVIPLLAQHYHVTAISTDGYDGTGKPSLPQLKKLEDYIIIIDFLENRSQSM